MSIKWIEKLKTDHSIQLINLEQFMEDTITDYCDYGINLVLLHPDITMPYIASSILQDFNQYRGVMREQSNLEIKINNKTYSYQGQYREYSSNQDIRKIYQKNIIFIPETNKILAFIEENKVHIYWNISKKTETNKALLEYILEEALKLISEEEFPRQRPTNWENLQLKKVFRQLTTTRISQTKGQIYNSEMDKKRNFRSYVKSTKVHEEYKAELEALKSLAEDKNDKVEETINYINKSKKLESWSIDSPSLLSFIIKDLESEYLDQVIKYPKLLATINLTDGDFTIQAVEKTWKNIFPIHPHVDDTGKVCLGNYTKIYPKLIAKEQIHLVLDLIIQFLENYNDKDPISSWIMVKNTLKYKKNWSAISMETRNKLEKDWEEYRIKYEEKRRKK